MGSTKEPSIEDNSKRYLCGVQHVVELRPSYIPKFQVKLWAETTKRCKQGIIISAKISGKNPNYSSTLRGASRCCVATLGGDISAVVRFVQYIVNVLRYLEYALAAVLCGPRGMLCFLS